MAAPLNIDSWRLHRLRHLHAVRCEYVVRGGESLRVSCRLFVISNEKCILHHFFICWSLIEDLRSVITWRYKSLWDLGTPCRPRSTERALFITYYNEQIQLAMAAVWFLQTCSSVFTITQAMIALWHVLCIRIISLLKNGIVYMPVIEPVGSCSM